MQEAAIIAAIQVVVDPKRSLFDLDAGYQVDLRKMSEAAGEWPGLLGDLRYAEDLVDLAERVANRYAADVRDTSELVQALGAYLAAAKAGDRKAAAAKLSVARKLGDDTARWVQERQAAYGR